MNYRATLSDTLFLLVLFFLVAGRLTIDTLGIKIGGKIENLALLVLVAGFLSDLCFRGLIRRVAQFLQYGLLLLCLGLFIGLAANLSRDSFEQLFRMSVQALTGIVLGGWIHARFKNRFDWVIALIIAFAVLQIGTPWTNLSNSELEGAFGHRNLQSAFYVLSFPLLMFAFMKNGWWKSVPHRLGLGIILLSQLAFILISRSRSGLIGLLVMAMAGCFLSRMSGLWKKLNLKYALPGAVVIIGAVVAVSPRFIGMTHEIGDPYPLSRAGVWSAALEGFKQPQRFLVGAGMGEGYFKAIQESSMGNLSQRYRRGHHPHCLYLQWLYWGGILALVGWFWILADLGAILKSRNMSWQEILLGSSLAGYVCLEIFETALKNGRIHTLFWLNASLLILLAIDRSGRQRTQE